MPVGIVRWKRGTAVGARTNRTWTAISTKRKSAALHALSRWRIKTKPEGEAEVKKHQGGEITLVLIIFAAVLRKVVRIIL